MNTALSRLKGLHQPILEAWRWGAIAVLIGFSIPVQAQIRPDRTLRRESSTQRTTTINNQTVDLIEGGAQRGDNLFHSFSVFNVNEGQQVYFNALPRTERIITRVTGNSPSDIQGTLGVLGNADLFLMNPNGILFGQNARLDLQGSFVATTADTMDFGDRGTFSALNPRVPAQLTIHPSALSFTQQQSTATIRNQSLLTDELLGMRVADGEGLFFVGGDIIFDGGQVVAPSGRIDLVALAAPAQVEIQAQGDTFALIVADSNPRANIRLRSRSVLSATSNRGGDISLIGQNIRVSNSDVLTGIVGDRGFPNRESGDIVFDARDRLRFDSNAFVDSRVFEEATGRSGDIYIEAGKLWIVNGAQIGAGVRGTGTAGDITVQVNGDAVLDSANTDEFASGVLSVLSRGAVGEGGDIFLEADSIFLFGNAQLNTRTFGNGNAGNITVIARGDIVLDGKAGTLGTIGLSSRVELDGIGDGGDIDIEARSLTLLSGAQIVASTRGIGDSGTISISVDELIRISGESLVEIPSGIFSRVNPEATGNAERIEIDTGTLRVTDGALITASTRGQGNAGEINIQASDRVVVTGVSQGNFPSIIIASVDPSGVGESNQITIQTPLLIVRDRGVITAETFGQGEAGNLRIQADQVEITQQGQLRTATATPNNAGNIILQVSDDLFIQGRNSGIFANTSPESIGRGGNIRIRGETLSVEDGGAIAVSSDAGEAGNLFISVNTLRLNQGLLTAQTNRSSTDLSATIEFRGLDTLVMQNNSLISARATADANGGNVTVNAPEGFVVAIPTENNDIIASAELGNGGQILITTQGIFGIEPSDVLTPNSDINASSEFGIDGVVAIDSPDVDPSANTVELSTDFSPPPFAQGCDVQGDNAGRLVNVGRGGTPASPTDALSPDRLWQDQSVYTTESLSPSQQSSQETSLTQLSQPIVEAQGLQINADGVPMLVAGVPVASLSDEDWLDRCSPSIQPEF